MPRWRNHSLAIVVAIAFAVALALSIGHGTSPKLPGIALGWPLLLHIERAATAALIVGISAVVLLQLWRGRLPTKLPGGVEFEERAERAPDRDVREQLLRVEQESRAAFGELRRAVQRLADGLPSESTFQAVEEASNRWDGALDIAKQRDAIANAISELPEREKLVIALHYYEKLSLREISEILGVTEARASQLHTKAILRLRARLGSEPFPDTS
jgi:RNA polymerase sigma factor (sigma-70 family)